MLLNLIKSLYKKGVELIKRPLFFNILTVGIVTIIVKILGFYKETVIAATFGLSVMLDTFLIAILIPSFIQNVFIGALKNIFIPNYIANSKNTESKGEFQSIVFILTFIISLVFFLITLVLMDFFLVKLFPGHSEDYYLLIREQLYFLLPCLFFWGQSSIISGLLEISNRYFLSTISGVFMSISILVCLWFFNDELGNLVLAVGTLSGTIITFVFFASAALYYNELSLKRPRLNENSIIMLKQLPPKISSGLLSGLNSFVDQFFAAQLAIGSITAISYGIKIPQFIVGILILALGNVLLPHFSRLINTDMNKAYQQLFKILKTIFISSTLIVILTIFFSENIISFLFERNEFTAEDTNIVSKIQQIAFIYVPFYLCTLILVKFLTSINKNKFMAWVSLFSLVANIILNFLLIKKYGVYGLVMATTIIYILSSCFYISFTIKQFKLFKQT